LLCDADTTNRECINGRFDSNASRITKEFEKTSEVVGHRTTGMSNQESTLYNVEDCTSTWNLTL